MPELPEVETTRRGIEPHVVHRTITAVIVRQPRLRWPVPVDVGSRLIDRNIESVTRRGKYLLIGLGQPGAGTLILHLGMSGSLRVIDAAAPVGPHDHVDLVLDNGKALRLRDPRRFGTLLWTGGDSLEHPLLKELGPEPLSDALNGDYLHRRSRGRTLAIKDFIMNSRIVAGVGNIYANEALFAACIHPGRAAGRIARDRYVRLAAAIKTVLKRAIECGGTTLKDFVREDGAPGYFRSELRAYGRAGEPCLRCGEPIRLRVQGSRATYYCSHCQR